MLAVRIIPTLLCRGRQLVKGQQFKSWRSVGVAMQAARIHAMRGVDELIILDIGATPEGRGPDLDLVKELSETCFTPLTVGGGVRSVDDVNKLLRAGADKVAIGTLACVDLGWVSEFSNRFGRQAITVSVDYRMVNQDDWDQPMPCVSAEAGRTAMIVQTNDTKGMPLNPITFSVEIEQAGAGEILLTSIDREGRMGGYDLDLIRNVSSAVSIPVIAHGGCGSYDDMLLAVRAGASAVAAGAMFQFTDQTPRGAAEYLKQHGVEVRLETIPG